MHAFFYSVLFVTSLILQPFQKQADEQRVVYLSFDDGPLNGSGNVVKAITDEGIKINVFVVGAHIAGNSTMKKDFEAYITNPLVEVGNHSYSHAHNRYKDFYSRPDSVFLDFNKCYQEYKLPTRLCRLPGRNMWRIPGKTINDMPSGADAADLLYKNGFKVIGWDLEWQHDAHTACPIQTVDDMTFLIDERLKKNTTVSKNNIILLLHDEMFDKGWEESELKQLIEKLKAKGNYTFEHISKYPGL